MNSVILIGRLTSDPAIKNEGALASFCLAVDSYSKDRGAYFIPIKAFGRLVNLCENYLKKGTKIAVCGHISTGSYQNRDGRTVYTTDIIASSIEFCESKKNETKTDFEDTDGSDDVDSLFT